MKALILVDLQNDFVDGGALAVPHGKDIIHLANLLQRKFDLVVATQDWHPPNHESFAASHEGRNVFDVIDLHGLQQVLWPVHCVQNTHGADFVPGLDRNAWKAVFQKGTDPGIDSYSGFFDNGKRRATGLGDFLKEKGVTDVYVLGLATDYCVKFTALDAASLGFRTTLIEDASRGVDLQPGDAAKAVAEMRQAGVRVIQTATATAEVERGTP
jgi:nicotinamidase/pyrazinamidase